jgi:hypothetical protein
MPYGSPIFQGLAFLRCALSVGHSGDALLAMAGASLERVLAGEEPIDGARDVAFERVVAHLAVAANGSYRGHDVDEPLALAGLACHRADGHPVAQRIAELIAVGREACANGGGARDEALFAAMGGQLLAGTPALDLV